ncbi:MAG: hypothetical protein ABW328_06170 [Ilumatobacteraceae bacterium]
MKKLLIAMALGAALAWLLDPDSGARRREIIKRKLDQRGITGPAAAPSTVPIVVTDPLAPSVASI